MHTIQFKCEHLIIVQINNLRNVFGNMKTALIRCCCCCCCHIISNFRKLSFALICWRVENHSNHVYFAYC